MNKIPLTIKELKSNTEFNYDVFTKEALISTIVSVRDYFSDLEKENKKYKEVIGKAIEHLDLFISDTNLNKYDTLKILMRTKMILKEVDEEVE